MSRIYVLQHTAVESLGTIDTALKAHSITTQYFRSFEGQPIPDHIHDAAGMIILGGPMGVYEQECYPFLGKEMKLIEQALKEEKPILGVCLGSQLIASALGARVSRSPRIELGWYPVTLTVEAQSDPFWKKVPSKFVGYHWHGDSFELPRRTVNLASSEMTPHQAFRYEDNAYGLLFHLEVTRNIIEDMVKTFAEEQRAAGIDRAEILRKVECYLPSLQSIGASVFLSWAKLVASKSR